MAVTLSSFAYAGSKQALANSGTFFASRVSLQNFRCYADISLRFSAAPVLLTGPNGSGKTNFLEAISLLVPGRGLKRSALPDIQKHQSEAPWAVAVDLQTALGPTMIGTGQAPRDEKNIERRTIIIDGKPVRSQTALADRVSMTWITPDMDRILAEGPGARRKFLDRLVYSFDPAHRGRVTRYEKAMRERLYLLREGSSNSPWIGALENEMAQTGVAIAAARREMMHQLRQAIDQSTGPFPQADIGISGLAEDALEDSAALLVEDKLRETLAITRTEDAQSGATSAGPHRSDLLVLHRAKACPAELCSSGEQKALLIAIILAYVRILIQRRQQLPLLLLDDITAHLDARKRAALFEEIIGLGVQAWMTGTDSEDFAPLLPDCQHFRVENGRIRGA